MSFGAGALVSYCVAWTVFEWRHGHRSLLFRLNCSGVQCPKWKKARSERAKSSVPWYNRLAVRMHDTKSTTSAMCACNVEVSTIQLSSNPANKTNCEPMVTEKLCMTVHPAFCAHPAGFVGFALTLLIQVTAILGALSFIAMNRFLGGHGDDEEGHEDHHDEGGFRKIRYSSIQCAYECT